MSTFPPLAELVRAYAPSQPWVSPGLQPVVMPAKECGRLQFLHFMTKPSPTALDSAIRSYGITSWMTKRPDGRCAVVSFDWALITNTILTVADSLAIRSNLYFTNAVGEQVSDSERFMLLATIVHELDWYGAVREHLPGSNGMPERRSKKTVQP